MIPSKPPSPSSRRRIILPLVVGGLGLLFGLAVAWLSQNGTPAPVPPQQTQSLAPSQAPAPSQTGTPPPSPMPIPTPYDYAQPAPERVAVEDDWFQDAVFIGDSRTDGLRLYGGISEGDFICYKGLTTFEFDNKTCISTDAGKMTALDALSQKHYAKVFLMLGLNELGYATSTFAKGYEAMLDQILLAQPNAVIYIQPVVPINPQKALEKKAASYITNEKIAEFNAEILRLAEEKKVIFVDVAQGLINENGQLPYDRTGDGIHFSKDWYMLWYTYLKTHTVEPKQLEELS